MVYSMLSIKLYFYSIFNTLTYVNKMKVQKNEMHPKIWILATKFVSKAADLLKYDPKTFAETLMK